MDNFQLENFKFTKILKSSSKYLIGICENKSNEKYVLKIANVNNDKITKEVDIINKLKAQGPFMGKRLAGILDSGKLLKGYHSGKGYYLCELMSGETLSHTFQKPTQSEKSLLGIFKAVGNELSNYVVNQECDEKYAETSLDILKAKITGTLTAVNSFKHTKYLNNFSSIKINGEAVESLDTLIEEILQSPKIEELNKIGSFTASLGHWNFHGDNILIEDSSKPENFRMIDPDVSMDENDPFFSLARFFYTFPHDSSDYEQYLIESNILEPDQDEEVYFNIRYLWPETVSNQYRNIFSMIEPGKTSELVKYIPVLDDKNYQLRLWINYLYCLIRGVKANYEDTIVIPMNDVNLLRNKGVYLYIQSILFAKKFKDYLNEC